MRRALWSVSIVAILLLACAFAAQATDLLGTLSFSLYSEKETAVKAGINQLVTMSDSPGGSTSAFYKTGFLILPTDRYGVFADLSYLRIDPLIMGIKPEFLRKVDTRVDGQEGITIDGGSIVVSVHALQPGLHDIVTRVVQNQGRRDSRILIFIRTHKQVESTDQEARTFGIVDASQYIADFGRLVLGISDPAYFNPEQVRLVRAAYFDSKLKGVVEFSEPLLDYSLASQGVAMRNHGLEPPLATTVQAPPAPIVVTPAPPPPVAPAIRFIVDGTERIGTAVIRAGELHNVELVGTNQASYTLSWPNGGTTAGTGNFRLNAVAGVTTLVVKVGNETTSLVLVGEEAR